MHANSTTAIAPGLPPGCAADLHAAHGGLQKDAHLVRRMQWFHTKGGGGGLKTSWNAVTLSAVKLGIFEKLRRLTHVTSPSQCQILWASYVRSGNMPMSHAVGDRGLNLSFSDRRACNAKKQNEWCEENREHFPMNELCSFAVHRLLLTRLTMKLFVIRVRRFETMRCAASQRSTSEFPIQARRRLYKSWW